MIVLRNGVVVDHVEQGDSSGLPVVLLHDVTDSWRSFERVLPDLPPTLHVLAYSQRGHGDSSRPKDGFRFVDLSEDLRAFLDARDLQSAVIVGHSMGSYVAQRFAMDHPARTRGLVLMGSCTSMRHNEGIRELWDTAVSTLQDPIDPTFVRDFQVSTLARPIPEEFLEMAVRESLKVPARVWRAAFADFLEADFSARLQEIAAPTLIAWGDRDSLFSRVEQEMLHDRIPNANLLVYHGGGHAFHWEDPAQFAADLAAFLETRVIGELRSTRYQS